MYIYEGVFLFISASVASFCEIYFVFKLFVLEMKEGESYVKL